MTSYRIHPAIGIGRLGNTPRGASEGEGWYIGPERPGVPPGWDAEAHRYRDFRSKDGVFAQGVRFRIFKYSEKGGPVELPLDGSGEVSWIEWKVELANRKAAFFKFWGPLGQGTFYGSPLHWFPFIRRNPHVRLAEREEKLVLSSSASTLRSTERGAVEELANRHAATRSTIQTLGDMRIDAAGRLIVCGGHGHSVFLSDLNAGVAREKSLTSYANNDGWFDDISDGPVSAVLHFADGSTANIDGADGAWFVCAPPDFAPAVPPVRSLWDTLMDVFIRSRGKELSEDPMFLGTHWPDLAMAWESDPRWLKGYRVSFVRDIQPILEAASRIPAVFSTASRPVAHQRLAPEYLGRLGGKRSEDDARRGIFAKLRAPGTRAYDPSEMPLSHGDYLPLEPATGLMKYLVRLATRWPVLPRTLHTISEVQYALLRRWAEGDFEADWDESQSAIDERSPITAVGLDQAALQHGVGGAFFPGIEASWLLVDPRLYARPFRLKRGCVLRSFGATGPIIVRPGFITAQMALPWQADFASCKKTTGVTNLTAVAWWPSQRPDDVLVAAPGAMTSSPRMWASGIDSIQDDNDRHLKMVETWSEQRFVIEEEGLGLILRDDRGDADDVS